MDGYFWVFISFLPCCALSWGRSRFGSTRSREKWSASSFASWCLPLASRRRRPGSNLLGYHITHGFFMLEGLIPYPPALLYSQYQCLRGVFVPNFRTLAFLFRSIMVKFLFLLTQFFRRAWRPWSCFRVCVGTNRMKFGLNQSPLSFSFILGQWFYYCLNAVINNQRDRKAWKPRGCSSFWGGNKAFRQCRTLSGICQPAFLAWQASASFLLGAGGLGLGFSHTSSRFQFLSP